jgi:hypothetical protein
VGPLAPGQFPLAPPTPVRMARFDNLCVVIRQGRVTSRSGLIAEDHSSPSVHEMRLYLNNIRRFQHHWRNNVNNLLHRVVADVTVRCHYTAATTTGSTRAGVV